MEVELGKGKEKEIESKGREGKGRERELRGKEGRGSYGGLEEIDRMKMRRMTVRTRRIGGRTLTTGSCRERERYRKREVVREVVIILNLCATYCALITGLDRV